MGSLHLLVLYVTTEQEDAVRAVYRKHNWKLENRGKGFYFNYKMKEHERTHTGEKPFSCSICLTFKCSTKTNLVKHMKLHKAGKKTKDRRSPPSDQAIGSSAKVAENNQSCLPSTGSQASMVLLEPVPMDPVYKSPSVYTHDVLHNGEMITHDASCNHNNMAAMAASNEMIRYNHGQYGEDQSGIHSDEYDPRLHADGYYGNINMSSSSNQMSQGLNILTVAMNMVNPGSY